jgi:pimeloyl-ACP methyl ester carboxylesterase
MEALAHTLPYDEALCGDLTLSTGDLAAITSPTLVLGGADSPAWFRTAMRAVANAIPGGRHLQLDGQAHVAADEALTPVLIDFFQG